MYEAMFCYLQDPSSSVTNCRPGTCLSRSVVSGGCGWLCGMFSMEKRLH